MYALGCDWIPGAEAWRHAGSTATGQVLQPNGGWITWSYLEPEGEPVSVEGTWKIEFLRGGPELPPAIETKELKSWTELGGDEAKRFGGTARYTIEFDAPSAKAGAAVKAKTKYKNEALANHAREERMADCKGGFTRCAPFCLASS